MIRSYVDALGKIGTTEVCSVASGRSRYLHWRAGWDETVVAELYGAKIVTFREDAVEISTCGYSTPSTFDGIAVALTGSQARYGVAGTVARVPYVLGHRMTEPTVLSYDGARHDDDWLNGRLSPLADYRGANLGVDDVSADPDGIRVTIHDWTYDGRDHTPTMRKLAAAYVGTPHARTRVVNRDCYPTRDEFRATILVIGA